MKMIFLQKSGNLFEKNNFARKYAFVNKIMNEETKINFKMGERRKQISEVKCEIFRVVL